jgi:pyruvate formate lyase activating enzyme
MDIEIKGFQECTLLDWPGKVAAIVYLSHCNLRCPFCHNLDLVTNPEKFQTFPTEEVYRRLHRQRTWIDGVVISGGEPTLHGGLPDFCRLVRGLGLSVKLQTNGTRPKVIEQLLEEGLVEVVAMDVKSSLRSERYEAAAGCSTDLEAIRRSMGLLMASGIEYEFHTTLVPGIHTEGDVRATARALKGARKLVLQRHVSREPPEGYLIPLPPFSEERMEAFARTASPFVGYCAWV